MRCSSTRQGWPRACTSIASRLETTPRRGSWVRSSKVEESCALIAPLAVDNMQEVEEMDVAIWRMLLRFRRPPHPSLVQAPPSARRASQRCPERPRANVFRESRGSRRENRTALATPCKSRGFFIAFFLCALGPVFRRFSPPRSPVYQGFLIPPSTRANALPDQSREVMFGPTR